MKNESVNSDTDFKLNEPHNCAAKYLEFGNNTHTKLSHSNTGHLKDIASSSSGTISDLVGSNNLPDAFPSFSVFGSSEDREHIIKEIDFAYQKSLRVDNLKTLTNKEENHNTINFNLEVDVIEKSNINSNE